MRITILGLPGSGKSWLARELSSRMGLPHVEADSIFWNDGQERSLEEFRKRVEEKVTKENWIFEGHLNKVSDIVLPLSDKLILITADESLSLARSLLREAKSLFSSPKRLEAYKRLIFNFRNRHSIRKKQRALIHQLRQERPETLIIWRNGSDSLEKLFKSLS